VLLNENQVIYEVLSGSHAYGLATPESDYDYRGIFIPDKKYYFNPFQKVEQFEFKDSDRVIYEITKFINLATQANPNILELLFIDKKFIKKTSPEAELLREHRNLFLTARCKFTYSGYAFAQLKRIKNHKKWINNPPIKPERKDLDKQHKWFNNSFITQLIEGFRNYLSVSISDRLIDEFNKRKKYKEAIDRVWLIKILQNSLSDVPKPYFKDFVIRFFRSISKNYIKDEYAELLKKEFEYYIAMKEWQQYKRWKENRNPKRAEIERKYGFDLKHSAHLVRLVMQGKEILTKGTLTVDVSNIKEVIAVKNGEWSYEYLLGWIKDQEKELDEIYINKKYVVPNKPDIKRIENLTRDIIKIHNE